MKALVALLVVAFSVNTAKADLSDFDYGFRARTEPECPATSPVMADWMHSGGGQAPFDEILGVPVQQGSAGFCFGITAADMLSWKLQQRVSSTQLTQAYFKSVVGGIISIFSPKNGGFIDTTLKKVNGKTLCSAQEVPYTENYEATMASRCSHPSIRVGKLKVKTRSVASKKGYQLFESIDAHLKKKDIVGMHYRSVILQYGYKAGSVGWADHASTIVARQWNHSRGTCDYVVRNSWGTGCSGPLNCREGYYSISESLLNEGIQEAVFLQ